MQIVSDELLLKKIEQSKACFLKYFGKYKDDHLEDFLQYCAEQYLGGRYININRRHLCIDYFRKYGNHGYSSNKQISDVLKRGDATYFSDYKELGEKVFGSYGNEEIEDFIQNEYKEKIFESAFQCLTRIENIILKLYFFEHKNMKQIGEHLGISKARISQIFSDIKHKIDINRKKIFNI